MRSLFGFVFVGQMVGLNFACPFGGVPLWDGEFESTQHAYLRPFDEPTSSDCMGHNCAKYCFNAPIYPLELNNGGSLIDKQMLYQDYAYLFDFAHRNKMSTYDPTYFAGACLSSPNRVAGMILKILFLDAGAVRDPTIDLCKPMESFGNSITDYIDPSGNWIVSSNLC
jgi:hypothetical protein